MLFSVSAFAEKAIIANCSEGKGCTFELSDIESDLLGNDFGRDIQPDDIIVLGKKKNGKVITYLDKKPRAAIDREWGGDGYTQLGLFNPQIQPLNGLWNVVYGGSTGSDCYGIGNIGAFIRKTITPGTTGNGNIKFRFPFNPTQLFPSNDMRWVKTGYNTYKGLLDFNSNNMGGMKMYYHATILSNKKIETIYTIEIKVPSKPLCVGKIPITYTLLEPEETEFPFEDGQPDDDLLPVHPKGTMSEDDLMPVNPKGNEDDLLPVNPKKDDLLPVEPGKKPKPNEERIQTDVKRIED
ncbi:MAG TPA: hypothetical protein PKX92_09970 [Edaphocola sp.]|nr:hypothetical protein [Edaphocola sp.]